MDRVYIIFHFENGQFVNQWLYKTKEERDAEMMQIALDHPGCTMDLYGNISAFNNNSFVASEKYFEKK